jgi:hypothetical protein
MVALLLNASYEPLRFIDQKKIIKLLYKNKVEVIDYWDKHISSIDTTYKMPATVVIKRFVNIQNLRQFRFSKLGVYNRDKWKCQYCNIPVNLTSATIDHVIPRANGGKTIWQNCVTSCQKCNTKKGSKSLQESNMKLQTEPKIPSHFILLQGVKEKQVSHESWENYF